MTYDPMQGGRRPVIVLSKTWDMLSLPIIGPILCKILGGGIGPKRPIKTAPVNPSAKGKV